MENINFNLGDNRVSQWALPKEFSEGKKIIVTDFQRLNRNKGETTARFVDNEGFTYRLSFLDVDKDNKERYLEVHSAAFKDDLATSVKREFGSEYLPVNTLCLLKCEKIEKETKFGKKLINKWILTKI